MSESCSGVCAGLGVEVDDAYIYSIFVTSSIVASSQINRAGRISLWVHA